MKRLLKSWVFLAFAVPAAVLPFVCAWRTEETGFSCLCGSGHIEANGRFDVGNSVIFRGSARIVRTVQSDLWREILREAHIHHFGVGRGIFTDTSGKRFSPAGPRDPRRHFAFVCRETPEFFRWLTSRHAAGRISAAAVESELARDLAYPEGQFPFGWVPGR
jgi:hypothetical protein